MANGTHATDGIVCRPVISEPTAARTGPNRDTTIPSATLRTTDSAKPWAACHSVILIAVTSVPSVARCHRSAKASDGGASTNAGFHWSHTTSCHVASASTTAATLGHVLLHTS